MSPHHLTSSALPELSDQASPDGRDQPHDSGYHSSDDSEHQSHDSNTAAVRKTDQVRPARKKPCVRPPVPPQYLCGTCKTLFHEYKDLSRHLRVSSTACAASEGHWECAKCKFQFTEGKSLKRHVTISTTKPSFACHTCGNVYGRKDNLVRHEKEHRGEGRRRKANVQTASIPNPAEALVNSSALGSIASSHGLTTPTLSNEVGYNTTDTTYSSGGSLYPTPKSPSPLVGRPSLSITPSEKTVCITAPDSRMVTREDEVLRQGTSTTQLARHAVVPKNVPGKDSWTLPLRPKHAKRRPGPKRRLIKCPSCYKTVGTSQQELKEHAISHKDGPFSVSLLCLECMICFERSEDLYHHITSVQKYGECGFLKHDKKCGGHHPLADGEIEANPFGDHMRMRIAVQNWELAELQDHQLRHDEVMNQLPDQGEDSERWTLAARSSKARSLWSLRSKPISKRSAPSHTDYMSKIPFRNLADRYAQVRLAASIKDVTIFWQRSRRTHLAMVGAIMNWDLQKLMHILRNGQDPNERLWTPDTGAANIRYDDKLSGTHPYMCPLILATEQGFLEGMKLLLCAGAHINTVDENCRSALDWAMTRHNKKACAILLAFGARHVERGDLHIGGNMRAFLNAAKNASIIDLMETQQDNQFRGPLGCCDHYTILATDVGTFKRFLFSGFSLDSKPSCAYHSYRSFRDLAQSLAPHLLGLTVELDLELLMEAIDANDALAAKSLIGTWTTLPVWLHADSLLERARRRPGVTQEVIDSLAAAIRESGLSTTAQDWYWYRCIGIKE